MKFEPVSDNFALSKGCGILIGDVFWATFSVLVASESVEVALSAVVVTVTGRVPFSALSGTVADTVVALAGESLSPAQTRAIGDKIRATRNSIHGL